MFLILLDVCDLYDGMKNYQPIFRERESFSSLSGSLLHNKPPRLNNSYSSSPSPASPGNTNTLNLKTLTFSLSPVLVN